MNPRDILTHLTRPLTYLLALMVAAMLLLLFLGYQSLLHMPMLAELVDRLAVFTTIFLGIFIETLPFLLLGTLASGLVEIFLTSQELSRLSPQRPLAGALFGSVLGLFIPVSEFGVVPFARHLFWKGLPAAAGIALLLAAPVVNPIVIASTAAAFGLGPMLYLRVGLSALIAILAGLFFARRGLASTFLRPVPLVPPDVYTPAAAPAPISRTPTRQARLQAALMITVDEFFEMGRYLVLGALLAALLQTLIPPTVLLGISQDPILSVLVLMALAVLLSAGAAADAFIALAFVGVFSPGSILAFLIIGPVVDLKNTVMYLAVFKLRPAAVLIGLTFLLAFISGVLVNLLWNG